MSNLAQRKWQAFKQNRRAKISAVILLVMLFVSAISELIANDKPLIIKYKGEFLFPQVICYTDKFFGGDFPTEADYKDEFIIKEINNNGWMVMPLIPFAYDTVDYNLRNPAPTPPSNTHWLGTDDEGRDILARILYGIRLSVCFAVLLTGLSSIIGIFAGAVQGYLGGRTDMLMQRFQEMWEALPQLFILVIVASVFEPTFLTLLIIMLFFSWSSLTSVVRAEFLRTRNFEFVRAARALGVGKWRIMYRHILPNAVIATITYVPFLLAEAIVALTALDFLGLGLSQNYPSLGDLVRQGKDNLQAPWIGISIFVVLSSLLTMLIFVGEGVRDAFDTRKSS